MALKLKPYPKSMGACADLLFIKRQERLVADKAAASLKEEEERLITYIIDNLPKGDGGAVGKTHKVVVSTKTKPRVEDWTQFYAYVGKKKAFDLLQRRLSDTAVADRLEAGVKIPGVGTFSYVDVSLTKV